MLFSWDEAKNQSNQRKHGVSFETAKHVFDDPLHLSRQNRIQDGETRWQTLGMIELCFCWLPTPLAMSRVSIFELCQPVRPLNKILRQAMQESVKPH